MRIFYLGNFLPDYSTETHISRTLQKMGHEVTQIQENFTNPDHLLERLSTEDFDLFLFTRTWGQTVMMGHVDKLRSRGIPSVSVHLDLYVGLQRDGNINSDPFWRTEYVFTADGDPESQKFFESKGINHYWLKPGVYKEECYIPERLKTKDVIFVGSYGYHPEYPYRQKLIDWLKNTYRERFEHWGPDGLGHVRGNDLNILYASTKVVVGDSLLLPGHENYWSDRIPETLGRGGFLIHPAVNGLDLKDRHHLRLYEHGNLKQLKVLIDHYLKDNDEREKIRLAGHTYVKENATYTNRMQELLAVVANTSKKRNEDM